MILENLIIICKKLIHEITIIIKICLKNKYSKIKIK